MYNKHDAFISNVYYLYFYGVNVFFQVQHSEWNYAYVSELKTRKINQKRYEMVVYNENKKDGSCLVVPHTIHNDGRLFKVKTNDFNGISVLEIPIEKDSEIYKAALRINSVDLAKQIDKELGIRYAVKISDTKNWYNWYYDYRGSDLTPNEIRKNNKIERMYG